MSGIPNRDELRRSILDAMPNRCCDDWRTCPYDQHESGQIANAVLVHLSQAWTAGYDAAMQHAHQAFNRHGYVERIGESDDFNPFREESK